MEEETEWKSQAIHLKLIFVIFSGQFMKLDKKRAKVVHEMHQKVAKINVEVERKKAKERHYF